MAQSDWVDVDFDVEKETWNVYDLADGTRLKMRAVLVKLLRRPTAKPGEFELNATFQNALSAFVHPRGKGPPGKPLSQQEVDALPKKEVNFSAEYEEWSIYKLPDGGRLKVKLVVSSIMKAEGAYNIFGEPLYVVNSTSVLAPAPKSPKI